MKKMTSKLHLLLLFILLCLTITACSGSKNIPQTNERDSSQKQVEIINDYINIRSQATTSSEVIGKVQKGEIYTVLETDKFWLKIQTSNNITGWIISAYEEKPYVSYLETNGSIPQEQETLDKISAGEYLDIEKIKYSSIDWISDVLLSEIKHIKHSGMWNIQPNLFITKSGELYEFSKNKLYSNEQVCKKVDTELTFSRFHLYANDRDLSVIVSTENELYEYNDTFEPYQESYLPLQMLQNEMLQQHPMNYGVYAFGATSYYLYYYAESNDVYLYKAAPNNSESKLILLSDSVLDSFPEGETCLAVEGKIFITDKAFYKIGVTNQDEVNKYEDVEPVYGLIRLDAISEEYSKIAYFNGEYIIYKDDPNHLYIYR